MTIVEVPAIIMRYLPFRSVLSPGQKKKLLIGYAIVLVMSFVSSYCLATQGLVTIVFYKAKLLVTGAVLFALNLLVIRKYYPEQMFACGIEATVSTIIPVMIAFVGSFLVEFSDMQAAVALNAVIYTFLYLALLPYASKTLINCIEPFLDLKTNAYWNTLCFIPMVMFIGNALTYPRAEFITSIWGFIGQVLIIGAAYMMCLVVSRDSKRIKERNMMSYNMEMQNQYYKFLTKQVETARRQLHDAKYRVAAIEKYIEMDDKEGLAEYCKTMIPKRYYAVDLFHSGNSAVDGVLFHYSQRAEESGISFKIAGTVQNPGIEDDDLCILLGNAFENAFTACMNLETGRTVNFVAQTEQNVLSLMVQNSFDGKVIIKDGEVQSRKRSSGPGIGLSSMNDICEKYCGTMDTSWDDTTFTVLIILPLNNR